MRSRPFSLCPVVVAAFLLTVPSGHSVAQTKEVLPQDESVEMKKHQGRTPHNPPAKATALEVGQEAPPIMANSPDGSPILPERPMGKWIRLVFWSLRDKTEMQPLETLKEIRKAFANDERLWIISVCTGTHVGEKVNTDDRTLWLKYLEKQGRVDYGDGERSFQDDSKWWNVFQDSRVEKPTSHRYGVTKLPESFLIGPDGRLLAVRIPEMELRRKVEVALEVFD